MKIANLIVDDHDLYEEWLEKLSKQAIAEVLKYIDRLEQGNSGKVKSLGSGVCELKIPRPTKLRLYFGYENADEILLICGGGEKTQDNDIKEAKKIWRSYVSSQK
jgi:putative addiction module killer protein